MTSSASSLARTERAALCELFDRLGPDAPTLCAGWTTRDLAAHLVVRQSRPDAALGLVLAPLAAWTRKVQARAGAAEWSELVRQVRQGPPAWSPTRISSVDALVNDLEFFVHHEDVRRAQEDWQPRELPLATDEALWALVRGRARLHMRRAPVGVRMQLPDGRSFVAKDAVPSVTVSGTPAELVLLMHGRGDHAVLECAGPDTAVQSLRDASFAV
ncbi:MAG: TIGR03085 family metal-binding protein [Actinomycetes bacterium]